MECVAVKEVNCALELKCQKLQSYKILEIRSTSDKIFLSLKFVYSKFCVICNSSNICGCQALAISSVGRYQVPVHLVPVRVSVPYQYRYFRYLYQYFSEKWRNIYFQCVINMLSESMCQQISLHQSFYFRCIVFFCAVSPWETKLMISRRIWKTKPRIEKERVKSVELQFSGLNRNLKVINVVANALVNLRKRKNFSNPEKLLWRVLLATILQSYHKVSNHLLRNRKLPVLRLSSTHG